MTKNNNYLNFFLYLGFFLLFNFIGLISLFLPTTLKYLLALHLPYNIDQWYEIFTAIFIQNNFVLWLITTISLGIILTALCYLDINIKTTIMLFFSSALFINILLIIFCFQYIHFYGDAGGTMALASFSAFLLVKLLTTNPNKTKKVILPIMLVLIILILLEGLFITAKTALYTHIIGILMGLTFAIYYLKKYGLTSK